MPTVNMRIAFFVIFLLLVPSAVQAQVLSVAQVQKMLRNARAEAPSYRDVPATLTYSPAFTSLWQQSDQVARHARSLLLNPIMNADDEAILVLALQNARWKELFGLYEWAFDCYTNGQLSAETVAALIFPSSDWNTRLEFRYKDPAVRKFLVRIQHSKLPQEQGWLSKYLLNILSGKAADEIRVAQNEGQLLDRNRKD